MKTLQRAFLRWEGTFDLDRRRNTIEELESRRLEPGFWDQPATAREVERLISREKVWVTSWEHLNRRALDLQSLQELVEEEADPDLVAELQGEAKRLADDLEALELRSMMRDEDDQRHAILNINPGAGGTESQDWAEMLLRMYMRWGDNNGYDVTLLGYQEGDVAGIKSATVRLEGPYAYGFLKSETGVHRLVRISPFDASGRRHTSFASVFAYPEIDDTIEVDVNPDDVEMQRFHSGGKGGQNVNKVETGVRLIWTGVLSNGDKERVVAECTEERSQLQNREKALVLLKSRIYQLERLIREAAKNEIEKSKKKIEWGSQIRSYVFQPYTMVNDHRTELKDTDVMGVMDGHLDPFIRAFLRKAQAAS